jgi:hypothetical protein
MTSHEDWSSNFSWGDIWLFCLESWMIFLALLTSILFELTQILAGLDRDWTDPQRVTHIPKNHLTLTLKSPWAPVRFRRSMRPVLYCYILGVQPGYIVLVWVLILKNIWVCYDLRQYQPYTNTSLVGTLVNTRFMPLIYQS